MNIGLTTWGEDSGIDSSILFMRFGSGENGKQVFHLDDWYEAVNVARRSESSDSMNEAIDVLDLGFLAI